MRWWNRFAPRRGEEILIAVDQEGGPVQRFREGFTRLPALSKIGDVYERDPSEAVRLAEEHAWVMASELRASGIDISFAPVADLARGNAAIGSRAFHADPDIAGELIQAYVRGIHLGGMAAILKHFPGSRLGCRGYTQSASDRFAVAAGDSPKRSSSFVDAFSAHAEAVMMAHVVYPAVDDQPAGYSHRWIQDILRNELGFQGAVISDDISMAAAGVAGSVGQRREHAPRCGLRPGARLFP